MGSSPKDEDERKGRSEHRSGASSKPKSSAPKSPTKPPHPTQSIRSSTTGHELPFRGAPPAKPLTQREIQDLREHKARLDEEARRKKSEEENAWMRRTGIDPKTGQKKKPKSNASSSSDSPIRRVESPERFPAHWTEKEKANHEKLTKEGVRAVVHESHRLDKDKIVRHKDYITIAWDGCKNIDIPWHRFRIAVSILLYHGE